MTVSAETPEPHDGIEELDAYEPDTAEASRFIGALIRHDAPDEQYTIQTFDDSEEKRPRLARVFHGKGNADALTNINAEGGGVFAMINAGDGKGRKEQNVKRIRAAFADADRNGAAVLSDIRSCGLPPHIVVESSPGKFHAYWLVDRTFPLEAFAGVQAALAEKFGTDGAVKDLPRVMRLPGFMHMKDPHRPFRVRILELRDHAPYTLEQLVTGLGIQIGAPSAPKALPPRQNDVVDLNEHRARGECEVALAEVPAAQEGERNERLRDFIYLLRERAAANEHLCIEYGLRYAAEKCAPPYEESQALPTIRSAIRSARNAAGSRSEIDEVRHAAIAKEFEDLGASERPSADAPSIIVTRNPLDWALLAQKQAPRREWLMDEWLSPDPTYCGGKGGVGKTLLAQQTGSALALGRSYIASIARPYTVLMWACEDDHDELWRRQVAIAEYFSVPLEAFKPRLIIEPRRGRDNTLYAVVHGRSRFTKLMDELAAQVNDYKADVVIIDNAGQTFGANENERHPVTAFMNGLAGVGRGRRVAPVLLAHPAKAQGSEYSGSTAWEAAVRMRWFMGDTLPDAKQDEDAEPDPLVRYISKRKQNYTVKDYRKLRFQGGALHPSEPPAPGAAADRENYTVGVVLEGLARITGMGLQATQSSASPNYLPKLLKAHELDGGCTAKELAAAMRAALSAGRLRVGVVGHYSNRTEKHGLISVEELHK